MNTNISVADVMTSRLITVTPETTLLRIKAIFDANRFHHLPVISNDQELVGMISKEDFSKAAYLLSLHTTGKTYSSLEYSTISAKDIMTTYPVFLEPDDTIGLAADIFLANKFHALPVMGEDGLVGIVTSHDLLRYAYSEVISNDTLM